MPFARSERLEAQSDRKVAPVRVLASNQVELPVAVPVLELLLALDCGFHRLEQLEVDQPMYGVALAKPLDRALAVLPEAGDQIGGHADVDRAEGFAGEHVDARLLLGRHELETAVGWTLKQVQGDDLVL